MAFTNTARNVVQQLPPGDPKRVVLEYLLQEGVGRANAKPWPKIQAHLATHGIDMSQTEFQQTILKETRAGEIFIGSNDHIPRGYFLIEDRTDADCAREFYLRRINAQQENLNRLDALIQDEWNGRNN